MTGVPEHRVRPPRSTWPRVRCLKSMQTHSPLKRILPPVSVASSRTDAAPEVGARGRRRRGHRTVTASTNLNEAIATTVSTRAPLPDSDAVAAGLNERARRAARVAGSLECHSTSSWRGWRWGISKAAMTFSRWPTLPPAPTVSVTATTETATPSSEPVEAAMLEVDPGLVVTNSLEADLALGHEVTIELEVRRDLAAARAACLTTLRCVPGPDRGWRLCRRFRSRGSNEVPARALRPV